MLSKGHAAPILYAAWAEAGLFPRSEVMKLREYTSDLEGHPTPRLNFVDLATGSLGQGLAAAVGIALNARRIGSPARTYVVMGDGESAEGSVWEAAQMGEFFKLDSICAVTDVNRLGQSRRDAARARPRAARRAAGAPSAGTPSSSTATTSTRCSPPTRKRGRPRASRR